MSFKTRAWYVMAQICAVMGAGLMISNALQHVYSQIPEANYFSFGMLFAAFAVVAWHIGYVDAQAEKEKRPY